MFSKLSLRNVKRSFQDYAIYFITLTFAVCLFYTFNSISSQQALFNFSTGQKEVMGNLLTMLGYMSIFVSVVLCFLILFANQFLIKRRKKEFGTYMTLGMSGGTISRILVFETLFIGAFSLAIGLVLGIFASQFMSALTSSLFDVGVVNYTFVFSVSAMVKTIVYFLIIFILVMIFNVFSISRYKLIDLIRAPKKNENQTINNPRTSGLLFILSILMIAIGYVGVTKTGLGGNLVILGGSIASILVATFVFFFSLSNFALTLARKNKKGYYKGLNMFVVRQLNSKINTTFLSITMISLMLTFTITILSAGLGFKHSSEQELKKVAPFDVTFAKSIWDVEPNGKVSTLKDDLKDLNIDVAKYGTSEQLIMYRADLDGRNYFAQYNYKYIKDYFRSEDVPMPVSVISQTGYKKTLALQGIEPKEMKENEAIFITNIQSMTEVLEKYTKENNSIEVAGKKIPFAKAGYHEVAVETENVGRMNAWLVVPDNITKLLEPGAAILNINYKGNTDDKTAFDKEIRKITEEFHSNQEMFRDKNLSYPMSKSEAYEIVNGESTIYVFIGIYLGIIFLISSAAILALQQLSEASDNIERFKMLRRIGVTNKMLDRAIFKQVLVYFAAPLFIAIIHSVFAIYIINTNLITSGASILVPALFTTGIFLLVYGGYFIATYQGYKRIIK